MKHISAEYQRRTDRASYMAGYQAGYTGRESQPELRHPDLQPIYLHGFSDGQTDKHNRDVDQEAAATVRPIGGDAA